MYVLSHEHFQNCRPPWNIHNIVQVQTLRVIKRIYSRYSRLYTQVMDQITEINHKWVLKSTWTKFVFNFCSFFRIYIWWLTQSFAVPTFNHLMHSILKNHQICHKIGKIWRKFLSNFAFPPWYLKNSNLGYLPDQSLFT